MESQARFMRSESAPCCVECGSSGTIAFAGLRDHTGNVDGLFSIRRCDNAACGVLWLDPRPLEQDIHLAYRAYFTHDAKAAAPAGTTSRNARIYEAISKPVRRFYGQEATRDGIGGLLIEDRAPGRVLDVGCGDGRLLARLREKGWLVQGQEVDPDGAASARAKGIAVFVGPLADAGYAGESFDVVTMTHVIEHLHEPEAVLRECLRLLAPGGVLVSITPNARSMGLDRFGSDWVGLDAPRHVVIFTTGALAALAKRAGFGEVRAITTAARADVMGRDSLALAAGRRAAQSAAGAEPAGGAAARSVRIIPRSSPLIAAQAMTFYVASNQRLRSDADSGEECVLWAAK